MRKEEGGPTGPALWHWYHAEVCQDQPNGTVKRLAVCCSEEVAEQICLAHNAPLPAWQPIETAPRDRTVLVVLEPTENNTTFFGKNKAATHPAYIDERGRVCDAGTWIPDIGIVRGTYRATHWMPLPEPPAPVGAP